jgi:predicted Zn-dependent protease
VVRASFDTLVRTLGMTQGAELRVIEGNTVADAMQGRIVMANASLAGLGEGERLFILAHELGHIALGHWAQTQQVYLKWVPGAVTQERTDAIADQLGREASNLSHRQEFEADAFALQTLHTLGRTQQDALSAFVQLGNRGGTATHPSTGQRLASLRAAEAEWLRAAQLAAASREVSPSLGTTTSSR